jgi:tRNA(Ile)-lysidine synthase
MIRVLGHSADRGLAAMPALAETASLRLLRPLLDVPPDRLRHMLTKAGMEWVEDPSNRDPHALRTRLRQRREGSELAVGTIALCAAAASAGRQRAERDRAVAAVLANRVSIRPEGFAILAPGPITPDALSAVIQTIGGAPYPPPSDQIAALAEGPGPATIAGVRLLPAGRLGPGLLVVREAAAMAPAVPARPGAVWDGRFRQASDAKLPEDATIGPVGNDAAALRRWSNLPSAVLRTLPALRCGKILAAVPHLLYPDPIACAQVRLVPNPPRPLAGAPFCPASSGQ